MGSRTQHDHRCEVVAGKDGKPRYRLEDGWEFTSPSAAGSAVMGGVARNGWRFWSVEGAEEPKPAKAGRKANTGAKARSKKAGDGKAESPVSCGECGVEFPDSRVAAEHMRDEHNSPEAPGNGGR